jgi:hypothetical protein
MPACSLRLLTDMGQSYTLTVRRTPACLFTVLPVNPLSPGTSAFPVGFDEFTDQSFFQCGRVCTHVREYLAGDSVKFNLQTGVLTVSGEAAETVYDVMGNTAVFSAVNVLHARMVSRDDPDTPADEAVTYEPFVWFNYGSQGSVVLVTEALTYNGVAVPKPLLFLTGEVAERPFFSSSAGLHTAEATEFTSLYSDGAKWILKDSFTGAEWHSSDNPESPEDATSWTAQGLAGGTPAITRYTGEGRAGDAWMSYQDMRMPLGYNGEVYLSDAKGWPVFPDGVYEGGTIEFVFTAPVTLQLMVAGQA